MKIYFAGSIRGGREDQELYGGVIKLLSAYGEVLTEHIGSEKLTNMGETSISGSEIYVRDMAWLKAADAVVAEVTYPSLGVGYELAQAEEMGKKIICLYRPSPERRLSAMIAGNPKFRVVEYSDIDEVSKVFKQYLS